MKFYTNKCVKYITRDREAGNIIEAFETLEEAQQAIKTYEETDKADGTYTPDFYEAAEINETDYFLYNWCSEEQAEEIRQIVGQIDSITVTVPEAFAEDDYPVKLYVISGEHGKHAFLTDSNDAFVYIGEYIEDMDEMTWDENEGYIWSGKDISTEGKGGGIQHAEY